MLLDTEGGAQEERFVGGSALLADGLAEQLADRVGRLVLDSPVRRIDYGSDGVRVTADGCIARGERAIIAIPPLLAGRIEYEPALPALREQLTQRMPQGSYIKCMAVYDKPFWREEGLTGEALYDEGPVNLTFDNTPPEGAPGVLLGFICGDDARKWIDADPGERGQAVIGCFTRLFGQRAAVPRRYIEKNWATERWTGGCPTSFFPPGGWTSYGPALRTPVGPIHWAGTETARQWTGYMEGALESAERAAAEVLTAGTRAEAAVPA
jgi:monoamine oxidase